MHTRKQLGAATELACSFLFVYRSCRSLICSPILCDCKRYECGRAAVRLPSLIRSPRHARLEGALKICEGQFTLVSSFSCFHEFRMQRFRPPHTAAFVRA